MEKLVKLSVDDAAQLVIDELRKSPALDSGHNSRSGNTYGCDIWIPYIHDTWAGRSAGRPFGEATENSLEPFYDAAWDLARRGIIRPGPAAPYAYGNAPGNHAGSPTGWSLTAVGREWIKSFDQENFVPTDPSKFVALIKQYNVRFGEAFVQRANETAGCYRSANYLAACAMAGAACEAILFSIALARTGDLAKVEKIYFGSQGRRELINRIISVNLPTQQRGALDTAVGLLSFWRDAAAHGAAIDMGEFEAHDAMSRLLKFAKYVDKEWDVYSLPILQSK